MKQLFYVAGLLITMFFAYKVMSKVKDKPKPEDKKPVKPEEEIPNDKIILVENVNQEQIEKVLHDFTRMYNEDEYAVLPRLFQLSENRFAITFPYDDALEIVCYLINYLNHPVNMEWNAIIAAWATVGNESSWEDNKDILNKKLMLYCSQKRENNHEYTEIITSENIAYHINLNSEIEKKERPEKTYINPVIQPEDISGDYLDFE